MDEEVKDVPVSEPTPEVEPELPVEDTELNPVA